MRKIPLPVYNDNNAFTALAGNSGVSSYPNLQPILPIILAAYQQYVIAGGNANAVLAVPLAQNIADYLRGHYSSPNQDLAHITTMRNESEHASCPMCGSLHSGTLDHLLPKNGFPAFAVFSKNLVPACKCNIKRKEILLGPLPNQRILHPYFDLCLDDRLIGAEFTALGAVPLVAIKLQIPLTHLEFAAISFHVEKIVDRTGIKKWLGARWAKLCRKPGLVIRELKKNPTSLSNLVTVLQRERDNLDELHDGKNNWESVFVTGLLELPVRTWLYNRMIQPGRPANGPLI
ncbi:hypothetical protein [Duganella levis]|uniref:Phage-related protein n=1 Tax=Duganella levis TaxID=2692169 RepID=A0ABW9VZ91_9BURK|nr:hypothetical protein [Duganella levis]MYN26978.1 hypothetical protein [Duganella levis]